jgi:hypothetical protein
MATPSWHGDFPGLPHAPQNLDLIRRHLSWTPAERLANLRRVQAFLARAKKGCWKAPVDEAGLSKQR